MNEHIVLNPLFHPALCVAIIIATGALLTWKEYPFRKGTLLMVVPITLVASAVAGLMLRPAYHVQRTAAPTIVLTNNYDRRQVDSVISHYPDADVLLTETAEAHPGAVRTYSHHDLLSKAAPVDFVFGDGLPDHVLDGLPKPSIQYFPGQRTPGITRLHAPDILFPNRVYEVAGLYSDSPGVDLVLSGPGGVLDSIHLAKGEKHFRLSFRTAAPGALTYTLTERRDGNTPKHHKLPLVVQNQVPLRVLMLEQYPTFESLYLKNTLGKTHRVTVRHQLSKGIFRYEHINVSGKRYDRLTQSSLASIDLLMLDDETLAGISNVERSELDKAIKAGLGCLVMYRSNDAFHKVRSFLPVRFTKADGDSVRLLPDTKEGVSLPVAPLRPVPDEKLIPVLSHRRLPAAYVEDHFGRLGYTLLTQTYPLLLGGDSVAYAHIWTSLVEGIARTQKATSAIRFGSTPPYRQDYPLNILIRSSETPQLSYHGSLLPVREDALIDNIWTTTLWPDTTGWQELILVNDSTWYPFYVHLENELIGVEAANYSSATMRRSTSALKGGSIMRQEVIDPFWFYMTFLLGAGWLWLWPKISDA